MIMSVRPQEGLGGHVSTGDWWSSVDLGSCPRLKLSYFMILQRKNSFITESDGKASAGRGRTGLSQGNSWERQLGRGLIPRGHTWRLGTPHCSSNYNFPSSNPTEQCQNALTVHRVSKWPSPRPGVRTPRVYQQAMKWT